MYTPESHYRYCLDLSGGDERVALLMMESAVKVAEGSQFGYWNQWLHGRKQEKAAA